MNAFLKTLLHVAVTASITTAAEVIKTGAPMTSGNVLIPAAVAGGLAALHAASPSTLNLDSLLDLIPSRFKIGAPKA